MIPALRKLKRWSAMQAFWDKARADDEAFDQFEKHLKAGVGALPKAR
jgi:hypothetical protein